VEDKAVPQDSLYPTGTWVHPFPNGAGATKRVAALRRSLLSLATLVLMGSCGAAMADCVETLSQCALRCDQTKKVGDPARPQCASSCVSGYDRCEKLEQIRSNAAGGILNQGKVQAPAQ